MQPFDDTPEALRGMANHVQAQMKSLLALGRSADDINNDLVSSLIIMNMGKETRRNWDMSRSGTKPPTIDETTTFLIEAAKDRDLNKTILSREAVKEKPKTAPPLDHGNEILATAIVHIHDRDGRQHECRALIDTVSTANFITEDLAEKLKIPATPCTTTIEALSLQNTRTNGMITATIRSRVSNFTRSLKFLTIPRITGLIPDRQVDRARLPIPANVKLADPQFHRPRPVDMLISVGPTLSSMSIGQLRLSAHDQPDLILQKTQFGWVIGGSGTATKSRTRHKTFITQPTFDLEKFWAVEEGPQKQHLTAEEQECEQHFQDSVSRDETGRYTVALPFNQRKEELGESRSQALRRLLAIEKKFSRDPELKREYTAVLREYIDLGHMSEVQPSSDTGGFYLPHHAVIKLASTTTKVRVVFDGSAKSSTGLSLNDALMAGPTIQEDLFALLTRFRAHAYVLTGDIEKMYRQFNVRPRDRRYQRILWRDNPDQRIKTYELNTVTFGLSPAPFLAIRALHQLAEDEAHNAPNASVILKLDLYVDDLLTGADTYEQALSLREEIVGILQSGRLNIRQWVSNEPSLLTGLSEEQIHPKFFGDSSIKTLGIAWDPREDNIVYTVEPTFDDRVTKRTILPAIARMFDPLGLLAPVIVTAKILIQRLWQLKVHWDESLPNDVHSEWTNYAQQFNKLNQVSFQRHVSQKSTKRTELHGFCDASERAYGACIYVRTTDENGRIKVQLLCAKSHVAPLKVISIARLELCGALLLTTLYTTVQRAYVQGFTNVTFWTDSTIVLNWLRREP
ncbi:PREDICTED: uncharacterized protein LOC108554370, partial [Eufriesea mexicana]|uniref:uncharacterized protein LOC108554370 n=1 Tax=Eufriesea mexicana TaxID=516756 RepID=UPI00083C7F3D